MGTHRRRLAIVGALTAVMMLGSAGTAFAHICINASKNGNNPSAGAQIIFGDDDEILHITNGLAKRIEKGLVDPETGEGFHGIIAFDVDGDGEADLHTFIVGPDDAIPAVARDSGPPCRGITDIPTYFEECI